MATAHVYHGEPRDYPSLGFHADPGDIACFEGRAPDERWSPFEGDAPEDARELPGVPDEAPKQPNKAASAAAWCAFAIADGSFQVATGTHPDAASRKAIVDHYTAADGEQPSDTDPNAGEPANTQE